MTPLNVNLQELIDQIDADLPGADPVAKIGEARLRGRTLVDLGDQLVDHYVHAARAAGASWSQIGDALGVTKQAAQQRRSDAQFEQYTPRARHTVVLAQDRARTLKHSEIGTEHLLLGLLGEPDGIAAKILVTLAGSLDAVSGAVHARLSPGEAKVPSGHLPMSEDAKHAFMETTGAALDLGHNYIGTEHILLGLLRVPESGAAQALTDLGVTHDRVREAVVVALAGFQAGRGR
jgi:Clp amino terminal domain, pathogenicity island component